jgi:hypothetical protein
MSLTMPISFRMFGLMFSFNLKEIAYSSFSFDSKIRNVIYCDCLRTLIRRCIEYMSEVSICLLLLLIDLYWLPTGFHYWNKTTNVLCHTWVSEWLLYNAKSAIFQQDHSNNKLHDMRWYWRQLCTRQTRLVGF